MKIRKLLFRSEIRIFDIFFKIPCEESSEDLQIVTENFKRALLCPIKWQTFLQNYTKVFF